MVAIYRAVLRFTTALFGIGAGISMALLFLIIFCNALIRYLFGSSLSWGDQAPVFLGIYGVMFGMALAYLQDRHVRLGVIVDYLPAGFRNRLFMFVDLAMIAVGSMLAWSGYLFMSSRGGMRVSGLGSIARELSNVTGLEFFSVLGTMAPYQFALVLGGVMLTIAALLKFIERAGALSSSTSEAT